MQLLFCVLMFSCAVYAVNIVSMPAGASVYADGKFLGCTPLDANQITEGQHTFYISKSGYSPLRERKYVKSTDVLSFVLHEQKTFPVLSSPEKKNIPESVPAELLQLPLQAENPVSSYVLLDEKFTESGAFGGWKQNTGGTEQKTWTLEKGMLQQWDASGLLHAITISEAHWSNYIIKTRMKILGNTPGADPRAGIIFRETDDGFYLFRIHRNSNKAQLAYHNKHPFGWNVIMEKTLPVDVTEKWYTAMVYVSGEHIACFLDSIAVFNANAPYAEEGKVGLYSVESTPLFDNLMVVRVTDKPAAGGEPGEEQKSAMQVDDKKFSSKQLTGETDSFWYTDYFDAEENCWYQYEDVSLKPGAWWKTEGGCIFQADTVKMVNEMTRYDMDNFTMNLNVFVEKKNENAVFEIRFRKRKNTWLCVRFSEAAQKAELIQCDGRSEKTLSSAALPSSVFGTSKSIRLTVHKNRVMVYAMSYLKLLDYKGPLPLEAGRISFGVQNAKVLFQTLNMASVRLSDLN